MKRSDPFERELVEAYESADLRSVATKSELDRLRAAARATANGNAGGVKGRDPHDEPAALIRTPPPDPSAR